MKPGIIVYFAVLLGLLGLTIWNATEGWLDYALAAPIPATIRNVSHGWDEGNRTHTVDFGICRESVVEYRYAFLARLMRMVGLDAAELREKRVGETATVWILPISGQVTARLRMPLAITAVPLVYLLVILVPALRRVDKPIPNAILRRRRDGSTEARQDRHRCIGCRFFESLLVVPLFAALVLLTEGLLAPFFGGELKLREALALVLYPVVLVPLFMLLPDVSVRWNDSTVWIQGVRFPRSAIRSVVLRPKGGDVVLDIHHDGSRWPKTFALEPLWLAAVLKKLGYGAVPET
jgi:hypothetical protein